MNLLCKFSQNVWPKLNENGGWQLTPIFWPHKARVHACFYNIQLGTCCTIIASDLGSVVTLYQLIFNTVIASKFVYKIMTGTYIRLYLTHADLQINVCLIVKSLTGNLLHVLSFTTNAWVFAICLCDLFLYFLLLLLFKHVLSAGHLPWTYSSPYYLYFRCAWVHISPNLSIHIVCILTD